MSSRSDRISRYLPHRRTPVFWYCMNGCCGFISLCPYQFWLLKLYWGDDDCLFFLISKNSLACSFNWTLHSPVIFEPLQTLLLHHMKCLGSWIRLLITHLTGLLNAERLRITPQKHSFRLTLAHSPSKKRSINSSGKICSSWVLCQDPRTFQICRYWCSHIYEQYSLSASTALNGCTPFNKPDISLVFLWNNAW